MFRSNFFFGIDTLEELSSLKVEYQKLQLDIYQEKLNFVQMAINKGEVRRSIDPKQVVDLLYIVYLGHVNALHEQILSGYTESEIRNLIRVLLLGIERFCCD